MGSTTHFILSSTSPLSDKSTGKPARNPKRTLKFVGLPLLGFFLLQADGRFPLVRFSNDLANLAAGTLSFLLPFLAAFFAFVIPKRWLTTVIAVALLLPLLCFSALGLLFNGVLVRDALRIRSDPAFERIATVPMGAYSVGVYLNDCGAPCGMDVDLLQERPILPGIVIVRALNGFADADARDASCKVIAPDTLVVSIPAYVDNDRPWESQPARSKTYHLKPFLYF
jgi:hypothetical protein